MAKKQTVKKEKTEKNNYDYLLAQMKADRDTICKHAARICELEQRLDKIVIAHTKCKSLKNL